MTFGRHSVTDSRRPVWRSEIESADRRSRVLRQGGRQTQRRDRFGNHILDARFSRTGSTIEFDGRIVVERTIDAAREPGPAPVATRWLTDPGLLTADRLTRPGRRLRRAAERLAAERLSGVELAARVNEWVGTSLEYRHGVTGVHSSAEEASARGAGVCQDYAPRGTWAKAPPTDGLGDVGGLAHTVEPSNRTLLSASGLGRC